MIMLWITNKVPSISSGGRKNGQKETGKLGAKREKHLFLEMWKEIENIDQISSCLTYPRNYEMISILSFFHYTCYSKRKYSSTHVTS